MLTFTASPRLDRAATHVAGADAPTWTRLSFWSAFLLLTLIVGGIGGGIYLSARRVVMDAVHGNLESIARIKVDQVERWLDAARREGDLALNAPWFVAQFEQWLAAGMPAGARRALLLEHLHATAAAGRMREVELRSADDGRVLLATSSVADVASHRAAALQAAAAQRAVLQDFHASEGGWPGVVLGIHFPLGGGTAAPPLGTAHIELDAAVNLLPFLNQWPGMSPTAETLLFRVDGGEIVYLNHSRHDRLSSLAMRRDVNQPMLLAAQVARGSIGAVGGVDYRGVDSIGYALPVNGTPWYLIAKIDRSEALAELDRKALLAAFALACLLATFAAWKAERSGRVHAAYRALFERALLARRLEFLARYANEGIILADTDGCIIEVNERCAEIYGYRREELVGMPLSGLWDDATAGCGTEVAAFETEHGRKDGSRIAVEISSRMIEIDGVRYRQALVRDVTARRREREELRRSEERARHYARKLEDLYLNAPCGYHSIDADGIVCRMNDTELRWLGYAREEIVGRVRLTDLMDASSRASFAERFAKLKREGHVADVEMVLVRKDGSPLPVMLSATAIRDESGNFVASRTTVVDISRLQAMQRERDRQARRLEALSRHLVAIQEEERRRLSCELNDRTAPNLAALKLTLDALGHALPGPHSAEFEDGIADAHALVDDTVAGVREVCADLRPGLLDYAGLTQALVGYTQQYTRRTGIAVRLSLPAAETRFGAEVESTLFRIVQEALSNVARHADASCVDVTLESDRELTRLTISDDGVGFEVASARADGPGLRTMRERAEFAGGSFRCVSWPGNGTDILVEVATPQDIGDSPWRRIAANDVGVLGALAS